MTADFDTIREALADYDAPGTVGQTSVMAALARVEAALDAADWYIENIEAIKEGRAVRGLGEAQSGWRNARAALASPNPEEGAA